MVVARETISKMKLAKSMKTIDFSSLKKEESKTNIRQSFKEKYGLVSNSEKKFSLPQVFLEYELVSFVGNKIERLETKRKYLGDNITVQHLEDCGMLYSLLAPGKDHAALNAMWRVHKSLPYFLPVEAAPSGLRLHLVNPL
jgi:hypothetical protein